MADSKELAVADVSGYNALSLPVETIGELLAENLGGEDLTVGDMERVSMPTGGTPAWTVTGDSGEPETIKEIEGVVIAVGTRRAYWSSSYMQNPNAMPDCTSNDGKFGSGSVADAIAGQGQMLACARCPKNQWGSVQEEQYFDAKQDNKNGKACMERRLLFIMRPGDLLPTIVDLSPASLKAWKDFAIGQAMKGRAMHTMTIKLGLEVRSDGGGGGSISYCVVKPVASGKLAPADAKQMKEYADAIKPWIESVPAVSPSEESGATSPTVGGQPVAQPGAAQAPQQAPTAPTGTQAGGVEIIDDEPEAEPQTES